MKFFRLFALLLALMMTLTACGTPPKAETDPYGEAVNITLSDDGVTVEGADASAVYTAQDIIYYEEGHDFTYGEGEAKDAHSAAEAAKHTVVHIVKSGTYRISGTLSRGQIAVDLGDEAESDPTAVVTLILDGADITCTVAPAIIFYSVYECGDSDNPTKDVDTTDAGANIVLASTNTVHGAYVARIYKPDSVVLNEDGTAVEDAKKLHKYDGAVYSKMTMNVDGEGSLAIYAENEGLDTEMHLTINGGNIDIFSGNDGINTNEDGVSVTTVNGGSVNITVTGTTGEGDGIDSNGWLVINGGAVTASACANSADAGIDSDMGIHISGGVVCAAGHMLDRIEEGGQTYTVFTFRERQQGEEIVLKNGAGEVIATAAPANDYSILILSAPTMTEGTYTLWRDEEQLSVMTGVGFGGMNFGGGMMPPAGEMPEMPEGFQPPPDGEMPQPPEDFEMPEMPEGFDPAEGERPQPPEGMELPENMTPPEGWENMTPPEGGEMPQRPNGEGGRNPMGAMGGMSGEAVTEFTIAKGGNMFTVI